MAEELTQDPTNGELRLFGRRHCVVDAQALCDHLDALVGPVVGEVIINNLETRLGREDGERLRKDYPKATIDELVNRLIQSDLVSGMGITKATIPENLNMPIKVEARNPVVRGNKGAAKSFLFSWWCGALASLLGHELELKTVEYDEKENMMKCEIAPRQSK